MKNLIFFFCLAMISSSINAGILVVEGKFQNKNIYIQNSLGLNGVGYCTTEIKVNGKITTDEINSSAFEIDLNSMNIKLGQKVTIEIIHKNDCVPIVLNPEVLKPRPTYELISMNVSSTGVLKWTAKNETDPLPYIIEQFKWNKWIHVGIVQGIGTPDSHDYSFQVATHSGENKFRIKQVGLGVAPKVSNPVLLNSMITKPNYVLSKDFKAIQYSCETAFEIYDAFGNVVKTGFDKTVNIENLRKGKYCLCFDNQVTEFEKKK